MADLQSTIVHRQPDWRCCLTGNFRYPVLHAVNLARVNALPTLARKSMQKLSLKAIHRDRLIYPLDPCPCQEKDFCLGQPHP
ncbi:hypothetical protein VTN96DRAFT_6648 [Rasamsonia emersonii]